MYIWESDIDVYVSRAAKFQNDTARAHAFSSKTRASGILFFSGEDAVSYFRYEFLYDLQQAMDFGRTMMSDGSFLGVDGRRVFENSTTEYRFTWPNAEEMTEKLLIQRTPAVKGIENDTLTREDGPTAYMTDDEFSEYAFVCENVPPQKLVTNLFILKNSILTI